MIADGTVTLAAGPVPESARGRWCLFRTGPLERHTAVPFLALLDPDGQELGNRWFFGKLPRLAGAGCWAVGHVAQEAQSYRLATMGRVPAGAAAELAIRPIGPALAAMLLLASQPSTVRRLLGPGRAHRALAELATTRMRPHDYALWIRCFEPMAADEPCPPTGRPTLGALVFQPAGGHPAALDATVRSLGPSMPHRVVAGETGWTAVSADLAGDYIAIVQAGEVLPPHAAWLAAAELERLGRPAVAIADTDELSEAGERRRPEFRPEPNHALMLSGTLSRGLWLVRRDVLAATPAEPAPGWAEMLRLDLWLRRYEDGNPGARRIPHVLSHRRPDTASVPPERLAAAVEAHLRRAGLPLRAQPTFPLRLTLRVPTDPSREPVGIVVPSTLRAAHALGCILALLAGTAHRDFELLVVVAQPEPLDAQQAEAARQISADPRARVVHLRAERFNFSEVNNRAVGLLRDGHVCLVNDDVAPIGPDWLDQMQAHLADPRVGIVGARLHYGDGSLQHGGVIMGVGGLCEHAHRGLPRDEPGYAWRAALTQEFSAVTAACMLVRRGVFQALGGFDEAYPSAFNDVDFCLRAREAGYAVVFAADAALLHHELQTYGSHYAGERAESHVDEVARMRRRWAAVIAADPFHNPNLSLETGREWCLAFPPRRPPPDALAGSAPRSAVIARHDGHWDEP